MFFRNDAIASRDFFRWGLHPTAWRNSLSDRERFQLYRKRNKSWLRHLARKKGFRDVWLHQHSSLVFDWVCARPVRRQRGNGPKYHGLLERWARRNCSFDEAFSPSMVKRIWGNSRSLQQSKSSLPRHSSAPGSWWVSVGCSEALELALYAMVKSLSGSPQVPGGKLLQKDVENPWGTPRKMIYRRINHGCFVLFSCLFKWSCILFMVIGNFPIFVIVSTY